MLQSCSTVPASYTSIPTSSFVQHMYHSVACSFRFSSSSPALVRFVWWFLHRPPLASVSVPRFLSLSRCGPGSCLFRLSPCSVTPRSVCAMCAIGDSVLPVLVFCSGPPSCVSVIFNLGAFCSLHPLCHNSNASLCHVTDSPWPVRIALSLVPSQTNVAAAGGSYVVPLPRILLEMYSSAATWPLCRINP